MKIRSTQECAGDVVLRTTLYPILMYHQIRPMPPRQDVLRSLSVAPCAFRRQMHALKTLGYRGVSIAELQCKRTAEPNTKLFGITFDDGFLNVLEHAMPILNELNFTSTCYFVSGKLGGSNDWDRHLATAEAPLMNLDSMLKWLAHGHEVGAHTVDHIELTRVPHSIARKQIVHAKHQLENMIGREIESFCYPYGSWSESVRELVIEAGFSNATTTERGRVNVNADQFALPRIAVPGGRGLMRFLGKFFL